MQEGLERSAFWRTGVTLKVVLLRLAQIAGPFLRTKALFAQFFGIDFVKKRSIEWAFLDTFFG